MALESQRIVPFGPPFASRNISDYSVIGDCRTSALVATDGAIDWCSLPTFDAPPVLSRLVDAMQGGYLSLVDSETFHPPLPVRQRYVPSTAIVQTEVRLHQQRLLITDFMPTEHLRGPVLPEQPPRIIRRIEALDGACRFAIRFHVAPDVGRGKPTLHLDSAGVLAVTPTIAGVTVLCFVEQPANGYLDEAEEGTFVNPVTLRPNERLTLVLSWAPQRAQAERLRHLLQRDWTQEGEATRSYWQVWAAQTTYDGPFRPTAIRSAITLKLLTAAPPEAAPSTARAGAEAESQQRAVGQGFPQPQRHALLESHDIRERNRQEILRLLRDQGAATRASLARTTRLSRTTVGLIISELIEQQLVREGALRGPAATGGRRPIEVMLQPSGGVVLGVVVTAQRLTTVVADLAGTVIREQASPIADTYDIFPLLLTQTHEAVVAAGWEWERVQSIGLIVPPEKPYAQLTESLRERLHIPIVSASPLLAGTMGEQQFGLGRHIHPLMYVQVSPQLGCAIIRSADQVPSDWYAFDEGGDLAATFSHQSWDALPQATLERIGTSVRSLMRLVQPQAIVVDGDDPAHVQAALRYLMEHVFADEAIPPLSISQVAPGSIIMGAISLGLHSIFGFPATAGV